MDLNLPWHQYTFVAFDLETTGAYPLQSEICEIGAVKWRGGQFVEEFQTLVKPTQQMSDFIIGIHGITNEMVANAPVISEKIAAFRNFIDGAILVAHHAPFDLGFLTIEFEKAQLPLPTEPALCSSLISRKVITDTENHRLQTLIKHLGLEQGTAHRARDDAKACLEVLLRCFEKLGSEAKLLDMLKIQEKFLFWKDYSLQELKFTAKTSAILEAIHSSKHLDIIYEGGTLKGKTRRVIPFGIVRNPDGDYIKAKCLIDHQDKRFYIDRITEAVVVY